MTPRFPMTLADIMTTDVRTVELSTPLAEIARIMSEAGISSLLVGSPECASGIVTESNLLRALHWRLPGNTPISELMSSPLVTAPPELDLLAARKLLDTHRIRHLVVLAGDGRTAGIVSETDFRRHLGALAFKHMQNLSSAMDREMPQLSPETPLNEALARMLSNTTDYVLCSANGVPQGILTERDIPRLLNRVQAASDITLSEAMTAPLYSVDIDSSVSDALAAMATHRVRHMLVLDKRGRLAGMVSQQRLFEQLALHEMEAALIHLCEERDRQRLQTQLDFALAAAGAGAWEYRAGNDQFLCSDSLCNLFGESTAAQPKSVLQWRERIHPDDQAAYQRSFAALLDGSSDQHRLEYRVRHAAKGWLWVEDRGSITERNGDGRVTMASGILADISQRRAMAANEASLRQLSLAIEQSPHSVVIANAEGNIEYVNRAFVTCTGYQPEEAIGRNPRFLKSEQTPPETPQALWQSLRGGDLWRGEFINRRKDGTLYNAYAIISPVRQADGLVSHYLAIEEDITERKRDQQELARYRAELENLVEQRTQQLQHAKEDAESASRVKSSFLANMSHEIRTPMNAILGLTHLLQRDHDDERLGRIADAANQLMQLLNDILDLSRLESGTQKPANANFALADLLSETCQPFAEQARSKGLDFVHHLAPVVPARLCGDPGYLRQILQQLLSNAVKFTDRGSITLSVDAPTSESRSITLRFSIRDTGIGIPADLLPRLFNPFEQGDSSTTRRHGGVGLGLVISRRLAELMDGRIGVNSQLGEGSEFWFSVTLKRADLEAGKTLPASSPPPAANDEAAQLEQLGRIPGLDLKAGLHAVRGKLSTYRRLLSSLTDNHTGDFARMRELLTQGENEEARRLAHSLKGAAATLGASAVFQSAADVDHAIRQARPNDEILRLIADCERQYRQLHDALQVAPPSVQRSQPQLNMAAGEVRQQLASLTQQLHDCDFAAQARLQTDGAILRQLLGEDFPRFERQIADFDFAAAAELLAQALARLD
ncbi:CBS domain-containing protein [Azonexus hydrophilus]|uniref:CBS domain-containing protein n=1 Tax=Azonexus hydrophilus TaxID=418702 RepID=UPI0024923EBA|nr:CBS domain-containing protein [Azonexus hydrophilus]